MVWVSGAEDGVGQLCWALCSAWLTVSRWANVAGRSMQNMASVVSDVLVDSDTPPFLWWFVTVVETFSMQNMVYCVYFIVLYTISCYDITFSHDCLCTLLVCSFILDPNHSSIKLSWILLLTCGVELDRSMKWCMVLHELHSYRISSHISRTFEVKKWVKQGVRLICEVQL